MSEEIDEFAELAAPVFLEKARKSKEEKEQELQAKRDNKKLLRDAKLQEKITKQQEKAARKQQKPQPQEPMEIHLGENNLENEENEEQILGAERRTLYAKINQTKELFDDNMKIRKFKVKPNLSVDELKNVLNEFDCIISIDSCSGFMLESCLSCVKIIEGSTKNLRNYNLEGLCETLRGNKEFHRLARQCFLKWNCYQSMPCEMQMLFLISTTAWIVKTKNAARADIQTNFLNQPV